MNAVASPHPVTAHRHPDFVRLGPRFDEALAYAAEMHREQSRKGKPVPYLAHLLGVASIVLEHGGSEDQAIAGLLHDVLEDCGAEHAPVVEAKFGPEVLALVRHCTDSELPAGERKAPWGPRKRGYIEALGHLPPGHPALLVSAADKLHNARSIVADLAEDPDYLSNFSGGAEGQRWYYGALVEVFDVLLPGPLSAELADVVARMGEAPQI
ncbi:MAG: HD domain-containing protein [Acidimicrobiia bacterium]